jgi:chorismate synthase
MLRYLTAGESHGICLVGILEGMPAGLKIEEKTIDLELKRRQGGFGRGARMKIESDAVKILSGVRRKFSIGSPISMLIDNKDCAIDTLPVFTNPRPGHADLAGSLKYGFTDVRNVLERSSARETAMRVAVGALCKVFLKEFGISVVSKVMMIAGETAASKMKEKIVSALEAKDSVGGIFEVRTKNVPVGLGSYVHGDRRLDANLASGVMSIPGIKAIEIGLGAGYAYILGSKAHDIINYSSKNGFSRFTNNAGGIEGGVSNGEDIVLRAVMKPIPTLSNPLPSVDLISKKSVKASHQRSDVCVVEAAGVVAEAAVAFELAKAFLEKFGSDSIKEIKENFKNYLRSIR